MPQQVRTPCACVKGSCLLNSNGVRNIGGAGLDSGKPLRPGSVAVVLRARPLRGGQPYVLLLQHNGVGGNSAAVQACWRYMSNRLHANRICNVSLICTRMLIAGVVVSPSSITRCFLCQPLLRHHVGVSGGHGRSRGSGAADRTRVAAPCSGRSRRPHAGPRARCQHRTAQHGGDSKRAGQKTDWVVTSWHQPAWQWLRVYSRGNQRRASVCHHHGRCGLGHLNRPVAGRW